MTRSALAELKQAAKFIAFPLFDVIPAKLVPAWFKRGAGIQDFNELLDARFRGHDEFGSGQDFFNKLLENNALRAIFLLLDFSWVSGNNAKLKTEATNPCRFSHTQLYPKTAPG